MSEQILSANEIEAAIGRLAASIRDKTAGWPIALVGIRSRGDEVAKRLIDLLAEDDREIAFGVLDISLYRDDFEHLRENPALQQSDIPFSVEDAHIILVDDVLFTGRTIRAALDALSDYGRPARIELAVLIDRGHREMPISADYVGTTLDTRRLDDVRVSLEETDGLDEVVINQKDSPCAFCHSAGNPPRRSQSYAITWALLILFQVLKKSLRPKHRLHWQPMPSTLSWRIHPSMIFLSCRWSRLELAPCRLLAVSPSHF